MSTSTVAAHFFLILSKYQDFFVYMCVSVCVSMSIAQCYSLFHKLYMKSFFLKRVLFISRKGNVIESQSRNTQSVKNSHYHCMVFFSLSPLSPLEVSRVQERSALSGMEMYVEIAFRKQLVIKIEISVPGSKLTVLQCTPVSLSSVI